MSSNNFNNTNSQDLRKSVYRKNGMVVFLASLFIFLILLGVGAQLFLQKAYDNLDSQALSALVSYRDGIEPKDDDEIGEDIVTEVEKAEKVGVAEYKKEYAADKAEAKKVAYDSWKTNKEDVEIIDGVKTYLFVGIDDVFREKDTESYADLLVLLTVNENNRELSVTNISRESYVYIPGIGPKRLADAYYYGKMELTVKTVEENYGINVDRYFLTDYEDYIRLINFIGGVDVHVKKSQVDAINNRIDELIARNRIPKLAKTSHLKEKTGTVHLDGAQTLAYLRFYTEGDYSRSARFQGMIKLFMESVTEKSMTEIIENVYPRFTTNIEYEDYLDLLVNMTEYYSYDILYYTLPVENKFAPFKEKYEILGGKVKKKSVLLNAPEGTTAVIERILTTYLEPAEAAAKTKVFNPIKTVLYVYAGICILIVLLILYLIFIHKRKIVYVDVSTGKKYRSKKSYRKGANAHPYHYADVIPGEVNGLFADSNLTAEFEQEIKMPMTCLYVYCVVTEKKNED